MEGAGGYSTSLFENTNGVAAFNRQVIGAHTGTWNVPLVDKCHQACIHGAYAGISYAFHTDSGSSTPATCVAYELKFIDASALGYFCRFYATAQARAFTTSNEITTVASSAFYAAASELYFLPAPPPPTPPPPDDGRRRRRLLFGEAEANLLEKLLSYEGNTTTNEL